MWRCTLATAAGILFLVGAGCRKGGGRAERNPYFVRGLTLRKQDRYAEAAEAFEKCLRLDPDAVEAHLQLATLYDDHLGDPLRALLHYRMYLARKPDAEDRESIEKWIQRDERRLLETFAQKYPQDLRRLAHSLLPPEPPPPTVVTPREKRLAKRIMELNTEIEALRAELQEALRIRTAADAVAGKAEPTKAPAGASEGPARGPAGSAAAAVTPQAQAGKTDVQETGQEELGTVTFYTVRKGESLSTISRHFYGSAAHWRRIYEANRDVLTDPNRLPPGVRLRIPRD